MNKKLFFAASVLALSGLMAACGSDETSENTTQDTATETVQNENETATSEETAPEESTEAESADQEEATEEPAEESAEPAQENSVATEGTLTVSESQSYEFYLLPGYELTAEEPNKDVIFSSENDELFMRVETFKPEEADFAFANDSIQQTLKAANEGAELTELPAFEEAEFKSSAVYEIPTENGKVTGAVFEKEGLIVKLTIFDLTDAGVTEEFLNMGKTITAE
ncbi:hypothetical protein [Planococcus halotolerans]|uniref:Lipoprotein n=1 Tax=Planococcus halotolerans TaxID=2233542 RepID=A0A365L248_9BACL|nr:hypothetical protein [Planococcus halotolerans]RAZ79447.1 hypothetical protein DP120_07495 [Planococcus halotolerans]